MIVVDTVNAQVHYYEDGTLQDTQPIAARVDKRNNLSIKLLVSQLVSFHFGCILLSVITWHKLSTWRKPEF